MLSEKRNSTVRTDEPEATTEIVENLTKSPFNSMAFLFAHNKADGESKTIKKILNFPFGTKKDLKSATLGMDAEKNNTKSCQYHLRM